MSPPCDDDSICSTKDKLFLRPRSHLMLRDFIIIETKKLNEEVLKRRQKKNKMMLKRIEKTEL